MYRKLILFMLVFICIPFTVHALNPDPVQIKDQVLFLNETVDEDSDTLEFFWQFGDGNTTNVEEPSHSYSDTGFYDVKLEVEDQDGLIHQDSATIQVIQTLVPDFTYSPKDAVIGEAVNFSDSSAGDPNNYSWDFGDGTGSSAKNPSKSFSDYGYFDVKLTIGKLGVTESETKTIKIDAKPIADFDTSFPEGLSTSDTIHFTDLSSDSDGTVQSWYWKFGDGAISTEQNPSYSYSSPGVYSAELIVTDNDNHIGTVTKPIEIFDPLDADFDSSPKVKLEGDSVHYNAKVEGSPDSFAWKLGDGTTKYGKNISHTYSKYGNYDVNLFIKRDADGETDSITKNVHIKKHPIAEFDHTPKPLAYNGDSVVKFVDQSADSDGTVESWYWDFDNGETSTEQNPSLVYPDTGNYNVKLTITDDDGLQDTAVNTVYIREPLRALFDYKPDTVFMNEPMQFIDESEGSPDTWHYQFDDGNDTFNKNPEHTYDDYGTYEVILSVSRALDDAEDLYDEKITVYTRPNAKFDYSPDTPQATKPVYFNDLSTDSDGTVEEWLWEFGDGDTSTQQNPSHTYEKTGVYDVSLLVTDSQGGTDSVTKQVRMYEPLYPDFTTESDTPKISETVQFVNNSTGETSSVLWTFDNGETTTTYEPTRNYASAGQYDVTLKIFRAKHGISEEITKTITLYAEPIADFEYNPDHFQVDEKVNFVDTSTDTDGGLVDWLWEFPDGSKSTSQDTYYRFNDTGSKQVKLTAKDEDGLQDTVVKTVNVLEKLKADFNVQSETPVINEVTNFYNNSNGSPDTFLWEFPDGDTSTSEYSTKIFTSKGTKQIKLTVKRGIDSKEDSIVKSIDVYERPTASFTASADTVQEGQDIDFTNNSTDDGSIDYIEWDFGDGETTTIENPTHSYNTPGTKEVVLSVVDNHGIEDTTTKEITILEKLNANFTTSSETPVYQDTTTFVDNSDGNPDNYVWEFSNGDTSALESPEHKFSDYGTYTIKLKIERLADGNTDTISKNIYIGSRPSVNFDINPSIGQVSEEINFTNLSSDENGTIEFYKWSFGDGRNSTKENPTHKYKSPGTYSVKLFVRDDRGTTNTVNKSLEILEFLKSDFTINTDTPTIGQIVDFNNNSQGGPDNFDWTFDDGTDTTTENPNKAYNDYGFFDVQLVVNRSTDNRYDTSTQEIRIFAEPNAKIQTSVDKAEVGEEINFNSKSMDQDGWISEVYWELGDGDTSNKEKFSKSYTDTGSKTITLKAYDNDDLVDTTTETIQIIEKLTSDFTTSPDTKLINQTVNFSDQSSVVGDTYFWDFDDGNESTLQNPSNIYNEYGQFNVLLEVQRHDDIDSVVKTIDILTKPQSKFDYSVSLNNKKIIRKGDTVSFDNLSSDSDGSISSYKWSFGTGDTSIAKEPTYKYNSNDTFEVELVVTDDDGFEDTYTKVLEVEPPTINANFNTSTTTPELDQELTLTDLSTDQDFDVAEWYWSFGDGDTSIKENPTHKYQSVGNYTVELIAKNSIGETDSHQVTVSAERYVNFESDPSVPQPTNEFTLSENVLDTGLETDTYTWTVETDSETSKDTITKTGASIKHSYCCQGKYNVKLTVESSSGDQKSFEKKIEISTRGARDKVDRHRTGREHILDRSHRN